MAHVSALKRWLKGSIWYTVVMAVGIGYSYFAPRELTIVQFWLGLPILALVLWPLISAIRERVHF